MRRTSPKVSKPRLRAAAWAAAALLLPLFPISAANSDPVASLIESEKAAYESWLAASDEPPATFLHGDAATVELFAAGYDQEANLLCSGLDLSDLADASGGDASRNETVLNFGLPRVRALFGDGCLVRPGDRIVAVGAERVEERFIASVVVRRERAPCPGDPPFSLRARLDRPLETPPLFFSSDSELREGPTSFRGVDGLKRAVLPPDVAAQLARVVAYPEDFRVDAWEVPLVSSVTVLVLTRRQPGTEDDALPSTVMVVTDGRLWQALWTERVDLRHGSGSFSLTGIADFDQDGRPEIIVDGVNRRCPYRAAFTSEADGWALLPLPVKRCGC